MAKTLKKEPSKKILRTKGPGEEQSVYSRILISKTKRYSAFVIGVCMYFVISSFLFANIVYGVHWAVFAFPTIMLGLVVAIMPLSETWDYKPWQKYPQQVERHYFD